MDAKKPYYEMHVTMEGKATDLKTLVQSMGWVFSAIDGDPVLGKGLRCYATLQISTRKFSQEAAEAAVLKCGADLRALGVNVTREKVELVLFDRREKGIAPP